MSASSAAHSFPVKGKPRLRIRNPDYFLDQPVQLDGSRSFGLTAPGLGKLFLTAASTVHGGDRRQESGRTAHPGDHGGGHLHGGGDLRRTGETPDVLDCRGRDQQGRGQEVNDMRKHTHPARWRWPSASCWRLGATLAVAQDAATEGVARRRYESGLTFLARAEVLRSAEGLPGGGRLLSAEPGGRRCAPAYRRVPARRRRRHRRRTDRVRSRCRRNTGIPRAGRWGSCWPAASPWRRAARQPTWTPQSPATTACRACSRDRTPSRRRCTTPARRCGSRTATPTRFSASARCRPTTRNRSGLPRALLSEARCLVLTGKAPRAMELLQRVRQRFPTDAGGRDGGRVEHDPVPPLPPRARAAGISAFGPADDRGRDRPTEGHPGACHRPRRRALRGPQRRRAGVRSAAASLRRA